LKMLLVFVFVLALSVSQVGAVSVDDARSRLADAYAALSRAESAGGNVDDLVLMLNSAAGLIDRGRDADLVVAESIIGEVAGLASGVGAAGAQRIQTRYIVTGVVLVVLAAAGVLVWFRGSRWFWLGWLRARRGWRVER
jgi:hypothetical protein